MNTLLTSDELQKLAKLSGLSLSQEEETLFLKDLQKILDYTQDIASLALTDVLQSSNKAINVFREDKVKPCEANAILSKALSISEDSYFIVPKVLK